MSSRREDIRAMIGLGAIVIFVAGFFAFLYYTDDNAYSQRIHRLTREGNLDRLLQIAESALRHTARVQAANAAGNLAATTPRREEIETRFVAGRDRGDGPLETEVYRAGLAGLNADLIESFRKETLTRADALIGRNADGQRQRRKSPEGFPKLDPGTSVDMVLYEDRSQPMDLLGHSRAEINAAAASMRRIGLVFNADRVVGTYVGAQKCASSADAVLAVRDLYLIDLTAQSVVGAARLEGSQPPQAIGVRPGGCGGATGYPPDLTRWFVLSR